MAYKCILLLLIYISHVVGINEMVLNFKSKTTTDGFIYPNRINAVIGQDVVFELSKVPLDLKKCLLTNPNVSITYNLPSDDNTKKVVYWNKHNKNGGCGVRLKNVGISDNGRWKLKAIGSEDRIYQAYMNLLVTDAPQIQTPTFYIDTFPTLLNITTDAAYCDITSPKVFSENELNYCQVNITTSKKAYLGNWLVNVGVKGKTEEIIIKPKVIIEDEKFDVGVSNISSKIIFYCNLQNAKNATFKYCRFVRMDNKVSLHLSEGLSNGLYSYYGTGLRDGECGMTIEDPKKEDFGLWKCILGYEAYKKVLVRESIFSLKDFSFHRSFDLLTVDKSNILNQENKKILSNVGDPVTISCTAGNQLRYCWLKHPNGTYFSYNQRVINANWSSVGDLNIGECGITIFNSTIQDAGTWKCNPGSLLQEVDPTYTLIVKIGNTPLVATDSLIIVKENDAATISCKTSNDNALEYCRFVTPSGKGFSIDESITENNALEDLYWYSGTSLATGQCQVTVKKVSAEHIGEWVCAGQVQDRNDREAYDYITLESEGSSSTVLIASTSTAAVLVVIGGVVGIFYFIKRKSKNASRHSSEAMMSAQPNVLITPEDFVDVTLNSSCDDEIVMAEFQRPEERYTEITSI